MKFPDGKQFAFTILDDTDDATVENVEPVYRLLSDLGMRTTKTAWPLDCPEGSEMFFAGHTLENPGYARFCVDLASRGFEMASHGATMESSKRERTVAGLEAFRAHFSKYPELHANHAQNRENLYWGYKRYTTFPVRMLARTKHRTEQFDGEDPSSPYFWGDLCEKHIRYVRNFSFYEINTLKADPYTPYSMPSRPYVRRWFSTSDAADVHQFKRVITRQSIDRLHREGGACILSTHLGKSFCRGGVIDPHFKDVMTYVASLPGWFVPVTDLLDHLESRSPERRITTLQLARLEVSHVIDRLRGIR